MERWKKQRNEKHNNRLLEGWSSEREMGKYEDERKLHEKIKEGVNDGRKEKGVNEREK